MRECNMPKNRSQDLKFLWIRLYASYKSWVVFQSLFQTTSMFHKNSKKYLTWTISDSCTSPELALKLKLCAGFEKMLDRGGAGPSCQFQWCCIRKYRYKTLFPFQIIVEVVMAQLNFRKSYYALNYFKV